MNMLPIEYTIKVQVVMKTQQPPQTIENMGVFKILRGYSILEMNLEKYKRNRKEIIEILSKNNTDFFIRAIISESGGGMTNTGEAICISSQNGKKMLPYKFSSYSLGEHATFFITKTAVACYVNRYHDEVSITLYLIKVGNDTRNVDVFKMWHTDPIHYIDSIIIDEYVKFIPLIHATIEKSYCYHCRSPHYYSEADQKTKN